MALTSTGCAASRAYLDSEFQARYRSAIHAVAILPFENLSEAVGAEWPVQRAVENRLSQLSAEATGVRLLTMHQVNPILKTHALETAAAVRQASPSRFRELLEADAILKGSVRTYREPSEEYRLLTFALLPLAFLSARHSTAEVVCQLQLISCADGKLLWEYVAIGKSKPYLGVGALFTSMELALSNMSRKVARAWPFRA